MTIGDGASSVGDTRDVTCQDGYNGDSQIITCEQDDIYFTWSSPVACSPVDCGAGVFGDGYRLDSIESSTTTVGSVRFVVIAPGFEGTGVELVQCQNNGEWTTPTADQLQLAMDECLDNLEFLAWLVIGDLQDVTDEILPDLTPEQVDLLWDLLDEDESGTVPKEEVETLATTLAEPTLATRISCGPAPDAPAGYSMTGEGDLFEDTRDVTCASGYEGTPETITCQADAQWSDYTGCVDIDGCAGIDCNVGADCSDVSAPGTGYICECPEGDVENGECEGGSSIVTDVFYDGADTIFRAMSVYVNLLWAGAWLLGCYN
jgi:hypothetical protein